MSGFTLMTVGFWITSFAPLCLPDARPILEQVADSGIVVQGRDPFKHTGLCGALLPVHEPNDVHYLTLPRNFTRTDLRLIRHFPHLEQVRCEAIMTETEYDLIREIVPEDASLLCRVRGEDGVTRFGTTRQAIRQYGDEDRNGDGIVNEDDIMFGNEDSF